MKKEVIFIVVSLNVQGEPDYIRYMGTEKRLLEIVIKIHATFNLVNNNIVQISLFPKIVLTPKEIEIPGLPC